MRIWIIAAAAIPLMAQSVEPVVVPTPAPSGIMRGSLLARPGTSRGEITFRNFDNRLLRCGFDEKTYFERENEPIAIAAAQPGERIELLTDRRAGSTACYVRTLHIVTPRPQFFVPGVRPRFRSPTAVTESLAPRGDLVFTGSIVRTTPNELILRSRAGKRTSFRLRPDTRYLGQGLVQDRANLIPNTIVFVRAGKCLDEDAIEAYQVVWGEILETR